MCFPERSSQRSFYLTVDLLGTVLYEIRVLLFNNYSMDHGKPSNLYKLKEWLGKSNYIRPIVYYVGACGSSLDPLSEGMAENSRRDRTRTVIVTTKDTMNCCTRASPKWGNLMELDLPLRPISMLAQEEKGHHLLHRVKPALTVLSFTDLTWFPSTDHGVSIIRYWR
jgi:hypothetical protein